MPEIEATRRLTRAEAADYLREFADQLDDRDSDPLSSGLYDETDDRRNEEAPDPDASETMDAPGGPDDRVTILVGNDSATVNPTEEVTFGVRVGDDGSIVGGDSERYVTFDLTWDAAEVEDETLDIK